MLNKKIPLSRLKKIAWTLDEDNTEDSTNSIELLNAVNASMEENIAQIQNVFKNKKEDWNSFGNGIKNSLNSKYKSIEDHSDILSIQKRFAELAKAFKAIENKALDLTSLHGTHTIAEDEAIIPKSVEQPPATPAQALPTAPVESATQAPIEQPSDVPAESMQQETEPDQQVAPSESEEEKPVASEFNPDESPLTWKDNQNEETLKDRKAFLLRTKFNLSINDRNAYLEEAFLNAFKKTSDINSLIASQYQDGISKYIDYKNKYVPLVFAYIEDLSLNAFNSDLTAIVSNFLLDSSGLDKKINLLLKDNIAIFSKKYTSEIAADSSPLTWKATDNKNIQKQRKANTIQPESALKLISNRKIYSVFIKALKDEFKLSDKALRGIKPFLPDHFSSSLKIFLVKADLDTYGKDFNGFMQKFTESLRLKYILSMLKEKVEIENISKQFPTFDASTKSFKDEEGTDYKIEAGKDKVDLAGRSKLLEQMPEVERRFIAHAIPRLIKVPIGSAAKPFIPAKSSANQRILADALWTLKRMDKRYFDSIFENEENYMLTVDAPKILAGLYKTGALSNLRFDFKSFLASKERFASFFDFAYEREIAPLAELLLNKVIENSLPNINSSVLKALEAHLMGVKVYKGVTQPTTVEDVKNFIDRAKPYYVDELLKYAFEKNLRDEFSSLKTIDELNSYIDRVLNPDASFLKPIYEAYLTDESVKRSSLRKFIGILQQEDEYIKKYKEAHYINSTRSHNARLMRILKKVF